MAPEEWPIAAPAADRAVDPARPAGRGRLDIVRRDFFLDPAKRLTEQERALMTALLHGLVAQIADDLRAALPTGIAAANDEDDGQLIADLRSAGLLDLPELIALLLRCADEERIGTAVRSLGEGRNYRHLQSLVSSEDADVSAAAMTVILAHGRRRDRLGQALIELDDLTARTVQRLLHAVGAGLSRRYPAAESQLAEAGEALLSQHDPGRGVAALVEALVAAVDSAGMLDEQRLGAAADEGDVAFLSEALARRAGIDSGEALDHLLDGGGGRLVLLLRMAGVQRSLAARILATLGELVGVADPGREIARFDEISDDQALAARQRLSLAAEFRESLAALEAGNGKRPV